MTTSDDTQTGMDRGPADTSADPGRTRSDRWVWALAAAGTIAVLVSNVGGIAVGDDGVGYRATADSLLRGDGLQYFLEHPLTVWPPAWPGLMAAIAKVTPLDPLGAAILLNAVVTFVAVLLGHRLLKRVLADDRLVLLGTAVIALGSSTIGFGHLLMTDFAFAVVVVGLVLVLLRFLEERGPWLLVAAGAIVWLGFSLRYAALYLIPVACLWLLLVAGRDGERRPVGRRLLDAAVFGAVATVGPVAWMLRNHSLDGTWTGPRYASARGIVGNASDIVATIGRFLLPGVANGLDRIWALVGVIALAVASVLGVRLLLATRRSGETVVARSVRLLGGPTGLLLLMGFGYLGYMLYVRSTTALNQLDLRLLEPAYLPLLACGLVLIDRLPALGGEALPRAGLLTVRVWAVANIAAGLVAVVGFATGNPYFEGNYSTDTFDQVRSNRALDALPAGCDVTSNLPNALYPELEAGWSPRRTGLESDQTVDDLQQLERRVDDGEAECLVWIDEQPHYGHLWSRDQLAEHVRLEQLATDGDVTVYRFEPLG